MRKQDKFSDSLFRPVEPGAGKEYLRMKAALRRDTIVHPGAGDYERSSLLADAEWFVDGDGCSNHDSNHVGFVKAVSNGLYLESSPKDHSGLPQKCSSFIGWDFVESQTLDQKAGTMQLSVRNRGGPFYGPQRSFPTFITLITGTVETRVSPGLWEQWWMLLTVVERS